MPPVAETVLLGAAVVVHETSSAAQASVRLLPTAAAAALPTAKQQKDLVARCGQPSSAPPAHCGCGVLGCCSSSRRWRCRQQCVSEEAGAAATQCGWADCRQ